MKKTMKAWGIYNPLPQGVKLREIYPFERLAHDICNEKNAKFGFNPPLIVVPCIVTFTEPKTK